MSLSTLEKWLHLIQTNLENEQFDQARSHLENALSAFPNDAQLWTLFGITALKQSELYLAEHTLLHALSLSTSTKTLYYLGMVYEQQNKWPEASHIYHHLLKIDPDFYVASFALGHIYQVQQQFDAAEKAYLHVITRCPQHVSAYYNLALLYQENHHYKQAFNCYEQVIFIEPNHFIARWNYASLLFARGYYKKAAKHYSEALQLNNQESDLALNYASVLYLLGRFDEIITVLLPFLQREPEHSELNYSVALAYYHLGQFDQAIPLLEKTITLNPQRVEAYSNLNDIYAQLQQTERARQYGIQALSLKDALFSQKVTPLSTTIPRPLDLEKKKKVISFSLWGEIPTYTLGAIENARLISKIYPDWIGRFYCDQSVPEHILTALATSGAEVILMPPAQHYEGLFWRFQVASDPDVGYFLCRDCDSRLNLREKAAVDAWIISGKAFHIMRDELIHSELILAGMWGGVAGILPHLAQEITQFIQTHPPHRWMDQVFLREYIWGQVKTHCLIHDSYFAPLFDAVPFPESVRTLPAVGQGFKMLST